jgi:hypothetical protein
MPEDGELVPREYAQLPDADQEVIQMYRTILLIFPIIFRGSDASMPAEMVGYQGNVPLHSELLREANDEYRRVDQLQPSLDPMFLSLSGLCTSIADRLETRSEMLSSTERFAVSRPDWKEERTVIN